MKTTLVLSLLALLPSIQGAPAPFPFPKRQSGGDPPLQRSKSLLGYSASNKLTGESTKDVQYKLAASQTEGADLGVYLDFSDIENPQPIRGSKGGTDPAHHMHPRPSPDDTNRPGNPELDAQNSDKVAPPGTDHGQTINANWPMSLSKTKLGLDGAGWSKQESIVVVPDATKMAGVDMRLEADAYHDLHWHVAGEWSLVLNGSYRETFLDNVIASDVCAVPHSIQALEGGVKFLLVFDTSSFSKDNTFLVSKIFAYNLKSVLFKNFNLPLLAFNNIPSKELFTFPSTPALKDIANIKIINLLTFPIANNFTAALMFFILGYGRAMLIKALNMVITFDYHPRDVAYFPQSHSHYIKNTGDEELVFLEVLQADHFSDIALGQGLGSTSKQIVGDTLRLPESALNRLSPEKPLVVAGNQRR
ncbi:oxalate decarboxylase [Aspergillus carlsbadensis]|nr:oxalate decarboxylase [Aspergillus carlsbadensis]